MRGFYPSFEYLLISLFNQNTFRDVISRNHSQKFILYLCCRNLDKNTFVKYPIPHICWFSKLTLKSLTFRRTSVFCLLSRYPHGIVKFKILSEFKASTQAKCWKRLCLPTASNLFRMDVSWKHKTKTS